LLLRPPALCAALRSGPSSGSWKKQKPEPAILRDRHLSPLGITPLAKRFRVSCDAHPPHLHHIEYCLGSSNSCAKLLISATVCSSHIPFTSVIEGGVGKGCQFRAAVWSNPGKTAQERDSAMQKSILSVSDDGCCRSRKRRCCCHGQRLKTSEAWMRSDGVANRARGKIARLGDEQI
jgi:hypothetical protein